LNIGLFGAQPGLDTTYLTLIFTLFSFVNKALIFGGEDLMTARLGSSRC
jgi:hypothetical protein